MDSTVGPGGFGSDVRVLVIDNDLNSLTSLKKMLIECGYIVTTSGLLQEGFHLLKQWKGGFDIVMLDINASMRDMTSFDFIHHVSHELDLPIIMMGDGDDTKIKKAFQIGACDYIRNPIKAINVIRWIWQHVYRKQIEKGKIQVKGNGAEESPVISKEIELCVDEFGRCRPF